MIALAFGALMAMAAAALLIWFVLSDKLLVLYATLFSLQALYVAFLSGQAFDWPLLSHAVRFSSFTWNVTAALSGAVACLFVREIADLKRFSPRVYAVFGWLVDYLRRADVCQSGATDRPWQPGRCASATSCSWLLRCSRWSSPSSRGGARAVRPDGS